MCLPNAPRHGGKQLRPDSRPGEWALGNTDPARRRLSEVRNALVEVHIPAFHAANHLLLRSNGGGRTRIGTYLAGGAELVCAKASGWSGDERHISSDARQTYSRSKLWTDQRAMLAKFSKTGRNGRRNQDHGARRGTGIGVGAVSLRSNPIRKP